MCNVEVGLCWHSNLSFENIWSSLSPLVGTDPWDTLSWETKTCKGASKQFYFSKILLLYYIDIAPLIIVAQP